VSARWDDDQPDYQRNSWLVDAMSLLSLDVTRAVATDLGIEEHALLIAQSELRRVLTPPFQACLVDPNVQFLAEPLLGALDPEIQTLVRSYYDRVIRYTSGERVALPCWEIVLARCAREDALWDSIWLDPDSTGTLRQAFLASTEYGDIEDRMEAVFAQPLSAWDTQAAVLQLFLPPDEGVFGIAEETLSRPAKTVRRQGFWRIAAQLLGRDRLRTLQARGQAFLATQADIASAFGKLHDPWLLAHPELTQPDTSNGATV
jgi:hypothetical protein